MQPPAVRADRGGGSVSSPDSLAEMVTPTDTGEGLPVAARQPAERAAPEQQPPAAAGGTLSTDTTATTPMREEAAVVAAPPPVAPQPGVLVVSITGGWASIYIDDTLRREGRTCRDTLAAGEHSLRLERPGFVTVDTTVTVESGETVTATLTMRRAGG